MKIITSFLIGINLLTTAPIDNNNYDNTDTGLILNSESALLID